MNRETIYLMLGLLALPAHLALAWTSDPTANVAVCSVAGDQRNPGIASDGAGGAFIAWEDRRLGTSEQRIYLQHLDHSGNPSVAWPIGGSAACSDGRYQESPASLPMNVVSDDAGGCLLWWAVGADLQLQRFGSDGAALWPGCGVSMPGQASNLACIPDGSGGAYFVCTTGCPLGHIPFYTCSQPDTVWLQHVTGTGILPWGPRGVIAALSPDTTTNLHTSNYKEVAIGLTSGGNILIAWMDGWPGTESVRAQMVDSQGHRLFGLSGTVVCARPGNRRNLHLVLDAANGACLAWQDYRFDPTEVASHAFMAHLVGGAADPAWPIDGLLLSGDSTLVHSSYPIGMLADDNGGVLIVYSDTPGNHAVLKVQHVTNTGSLLWTSSGSLLADDPDMDIPSSLVSDLHGGLIALWSSKDHQVRANRVLANGTSAWATSGVTICSAPQPFPGAPAGVVATSDSAGGALAVWVDYRNNVMGTPSPVSDLYAQNIHTDGSLGGDVVGTLLSFVAADATPEHVHLSWQTSTFAVTRTTVERTADGAGWIALADLTPDGVGELSFSDEAVLPGHRYGYRLSFVISGTVTTAGETWVTTPEVARLSLRGAQPNPSVSGATIQFSLPDHRPATLELLDVAGRRVITREVGMLGAGSHVLRLAPEGSTLPPGVYRLRLRNSNTSCTSAVIVVR